MARKTGRKPLGNKKRIHGIVLRFNDSELQMVKETMGTYNLDFTKRGVVAPFLRRLILDKQQAEDTKKLPGPSANLIYQINRIGTNINQLTATAHAKNLRSPSAKLDAEIEKTNTLLMLILELLSEKLP